MIGVVLALPLLAAAGLLLALPRIDLAGVAASYASGALGRAVTIESLRVTPGLPTRIALRGLRVANIEGGTRPDMVELERLDASLAPLPAYTAATESYTPNVRWRGGGWGRSASTCSPSNQTGRCPSPTSTSI